MSQEPKEPKPLTREERKLMLLESRVFNIQENIDVHYEFIKSLQGELRQLRDSHKQSLDEMDNVATRLDELEYDWEQLAATFNRPTCHSPNSPFE